MPPLMDCVTHVFGNAVVGFMSTVNLKRPIETAESQLLIPVSLVARIDSHVMNCTDNRQGGGSALRPGHVVGARSRLRARVPPRLIEPRRVDPMVEPVSW